MKFLKDAHVIADAATKWPQLGTDASDLYFGPGTDDPSFGYVDNIVENLKAARDWGKDEWGFDPYISLTCSDPYNVCNKNVDGDPRPIACYVNNTSTWYGGTWSQISCCGSYFTTPTNDEIFQQNKGKDKDSLSLITGKRPHIVDARFDPQNGANRRIYGPKDCALAARLEGPKTTTTNADSYATFALAMYWKDIFQGKVPQPAVDGAEAPAGYVDLISDHDLNYKEIPVGTAADQTTLTCAGTPADKPSTTQPWAQNKINEYCDHITGNNPAPWVVNSGTNQYGPMGYAAGNAAPDSDNDLWISVVFDFSCSKDASYKVDVDQCKTLLSMALNGCNTDTTTKKYGGQIQANCALWNITTKAGHDSTPPNGYPGLPA
ncbi:uncharacterized protein Z518_03687 [Rhinocladiella mackenziei CBS 650.93]|uniref:Uncharacterized protein n=1 Tax=Rhinocladiella mackenziei CBS 650.93 TaxID=1442369 RepID=A0A0D2J9B7_9EURO|nr:uncharacterized protein Z518_03687 [Rhinocladiella mackenziei CBS 650.93]KIX05715.1 hypothetical protein Z518_03687 [Rhinocladiella mackenziei CBS 650.93]